MEKTGVQTENQDQNSWVWSRSSLSHEQLEELIRQQIDALTNKLAVMSELFWKLDSDPNKRICWYGMRNTITPWPRSSAGINEQLAALCKSQYSADFKKSKLTLKNIYIFLFFLY